MCLNPTPAYRDEHVVHETHAVAQRHRIAANARGELVSHVLRVTHPVETQRV